MKKILFIVPLMVISFLASCNKGPVSTLPIKSHWYMNASGNILLIADNYFEYNDKGLLIKDTSQYVQADITEINEYEYDEKGNITKNTNTYIENGKIIDVPIVTEYTYTYDKKDRITKEVEKEKGDDEQKISEYTYEADLTDWKTFKYTDIDGKVANVVTRTFKDGLYQKAVDSITNKHYYYTWDEYKCNTKIEIYLGEGKTPDKHFSDQTYEYHKNMPNKISKYVLSYFDGGEIESNETYLTEYDGHDRMIKISNYNEQVLNSYWTYEYKD